MSWFRCVLLLIMIYLLNVKSIRKTKPFYKKNHNIVQLNSKKYEETINSIEKGDLYFVEYFSHWCHWCKAFKGQYINFANFIKRYHNGDNNGYKIKLFAIDLEDRNDDTHTIGQRYNITGYPTVLLFMESPNKFIKQSPGGSKYDLYNFLKQILKTYNIPIELAEFPSEFCLNSVSGPKFITDSKGWICPINHIDQTTQCCEIWIDDYYSVCNSIKKCDDYYPCCIDYESCIACCLNKINDNFDGEILQYSFHTNDRKKLLSIENKHFSNFTFCRHECRTSSQSTFEGNVYVDDRKYYCYQKDIKLYQQPEKLLKYMAEQNEKYDNEYEIIIGDKGESCIDVCQENNDKNVKMKCVRDKELMSKINSCTAIEKYFDKCNGGCMFGYDDFLPAFSTSLSRCYVKATLAKHHDFSCNAKDSDHKRLCLCKVLAERANNEV